MKKYIFSGLLLMASMNAFAQMQVDKQIQMTGAAVNDRRIIDISNASAVTPAAFDAVNITTLQSNYLNYKVSTGGGGAYTVALTPAIIAYWDGMIISFRATAVNTGATTFNAGGGAQAIVKANGQALVAGDIRANQMVSNVLQISS